MNINNRYTFLSRNILKILIDSEFIDNRYDDCVFYRKVENNKYVLAIQGSHNSKIGKKLLKKLRQEGYIIRAIKFDTKILSFKLFEISD